MPRPSLTATITEAPPAPAEPLDALNVAHLLAVARHRRLAEALARALTTLDALSDGSLVEVPDDLEATLAITAPLGLNADSFSRMLGHVHDAKRHADLAASIGETGAERARIENEMQKVRAKMAPLKAQLVTLGDEWRELEERDKARRLNETYAAGAERNLRDARARLAQALARAADAEA